MSTMAGDEIGYAWLAARYDVQAIQPLPLESRIGRRRQTYDQAGRRLEYYTEAMRPQGTLGAHLHLDSELVGRKQLAQRRPLSFASGRV